jgi:heme/copper-type cytochrome/quinol oxidase subunit 4
MLTKWESRWAFVRTAAAVVSVFIQLVGMCLIMHYNHILMLHK